MYDDMVMEPTKCCEVVGVGGSALGPGDDVVGLEPIPGDTSVGGAASVPIQDGSPQFGCNHSGRSSGCQWLTALEGDPFD